MVQQFTPGRGPSGIDLQNFTGNFESVPPYEGHPHGRVLYGTARTGRLTRRSCG
ncbi:hypothetical protein PV963_00460 [Streptomyces coeruleorubidus]|uniref:hypothetical protein n=1 Tax=Streptomyces coeruleorubidus TaxID=116188 RepID=UPI00237F0639|nr:hypothetical protein [Streptomyces coeruleorubidus]WDV49110.1 hypothetical protein PV963_00460 [Streptomyces coeruleorubidus]